MLKKATLSSCEAAAGFVPTRWYNENSGACQESGDRCFRQVSSKKMVDHGDEGWEFVGHRLGDGCCLDRHSRGHWRCCWSAPQSPALFHQGPEFGPQGLR